MNRILQVTDCVMPLWDVLNDFAIGPLFAQPPVGPDAEAVSH